jgi:hypothetical protein
MPPTPSGRAHFEIQKRLFPKREQYCGAMHCRIIQELTHWRRGVDACVSSRRERAGREPST